MSSAGYATPFLTFVYFTLTDFMRTFLWYISISLGLSHSSIIYSTLYASRLVLALLRIMRKVFSMQNNICFNVQQVRHYPSWFGHGPLGYIVGLIQELILDILDSAHTAFRFDPRFLASASTRYWSWSIVIL